MKKIATVILSAFMAFSFVACEPQPLTPSLDDRVITWNNYMENCDGYVYDYYKYIVPSAFDQDNAEYEVTSKVYDDEGVQLDNVGNMFLISEEGDYTIEFTAFDGKKSHTVKTVVSAIYKSKYSFSDTKFVYGLNETINLNDKVSATYDAEILYSVTKNDQPIALTDNQFTASEYGSYKVTATQEKQPEFVFSLEVVDKEKYPYANGMIEDGTQTEQSITATPVYNVDGTRANAATISVTHDVTAKFDENSNGSTKISVEFPQTSNCFDLPIMLKPHFSKTYYQALESGGYEYVAVRMRVEDVEEIGAYGIFFLGGNGKAISYKRYDQNGALINEGYDSAFWSGTGYQLSQQGWFEFLIPIQDFISEYSENMQLMKLRTYEPDTKNSYYGSLNIYIDNIYAVKAFDGESVFEEKALNDTMALSELVGEIDDVDELFTNYKVNGERKTFSSQTGEVTFDENTALYSFEFRARNRFGVAKRTFTTFDASTYVYKFYDDTVGTAFASYYVGSGPATLTPQYDTTVKYNSETDRGSLKFDIVGGCYFNLNVVPYKDKAHYTAMKEQGYEYVTVRMAVAPLNGADGTLRFCSSDAKDEFGWPISHPTFFANSPNIGVTTYYAGTNNKLGMEYELYVYQTAPVWIETSISIDSFLNGYAEGSVDIVKLMCSYANVSVWLDGIYLTKTGRIGN